MRNVLPWLLPALALVGLTPCRADVKLPALISDNMVLQISPQTPLWGTADSATASFDVATLSTAM